MGWQKYVSGAKISWVEAFDNNAPIDDAVWNDDEFVAIREISRQYSEAESDAISNLVQGIGILKGAKLWPDPADAFSEVEKQLNSLAKQAPRERKGEIEDFLLSLYDSLSTTVNMLKIMGTDLERLSTGLSKPVKVRPSKSPKSPQKPKEQQLQSDINIGDITRLEREDEKRRLSQSPSSSQKPPKSKPKRSYGGWKMYTSGRKTSYVENLTNKYSVPDAFNYDEDYLAVKEMILFYYDAVQKAYVFTSQADSLLTEVGLLPSPTVAVGDALSRIATLVESIPRAFQGRAKDTVYPVEEELNIVVNDLLSVQKDLLGFLKGLDKVSLRAKQKR